MSSREKVIAYLKIGKNNKEIAELCNVSVRTVERYKKEFATNDSDKKSDKRQNRKIAKEAAKILIQEGVSISEVAKQTETPRGTIGRWSSEENLQQSQLKYLKSFHEDMRERIKANKLKRLSLNEEALYSVEEEINAGDVGKATFEKIKLSEEIEQSIFEVNRIDRLERLELEKLKVIKPDEEDTEDNILQIEVLD